MSSNMAIKIKKKLIEVSLPLEAINKGCEEDKNRKTGHIRNLHKWFAPMPLPSWRAMLFAALVDEPDSSDGGKEKSRLFGIIERLSHFDAYKDRNFLKRQRPRFEINLETSMLRLSTHFAAAVARYWKLNGLV